MRAREFVTESNRAEPIYEKNMVPVFKKKIFENVMQYHKFLMSSKQYTEKLHNCRNHPLKHYSTMLEDTSASRQARSFADEIMSLDNRTHVDIREGGKLSLIHVMTMPDNKVIDIYGFISPKTIEKIYYEDDGTIEYILFDDGETYPESGELVNIGGINITTTLMFPDMSSARKAYTSLWFKINSMEAHGWKVKSELSENVADNEEIDEMALPADWDPAALGHDKTFKSRLEYAKERAQRLGSGSSRVAFIIPDQGRDTVLKIAKNNKGLAQNEAELDILNDGYVGKLDIVIPLIDYDKENPQPTWIQTELAQKASDMKLSKIMRSGRYLFYVVGYAQYLLGKTDWSAMQGLEHLKKLSDEDAEIFREYATQIAEVLSATSLQAGDLDRAANWGLYNGKPVIIDLGYTESVAKLYWG